jgi:hypothetical protein
MNAMTYKYQSKLVSSILGQAQNDLGGDPENTCIFEANVCISFSPGPANHKRSIIFCRKEWWT